MVRRGTLNDTPGSIAPKAIFVSLAARDIEELNGEAARELTAVRLAGGWAGGREQNTGPELKRPTRRMCKAVGGGRLSI